MKLLTILNSHLLQEQVSDDVMTIDEFKALDSNAQVKEMLRVKIKHKKDYIRKATIKQSRLQLEQNLEKIFDGRIQQYFTQYYTLKRYKQRY